MEDYCKAVRKAADFLSEHIDIPPEIGIMTGTGLGRCLSDLEPGFVSDYEEIPGFPVSTVKSHAGRLAIGRMKGRSVMTMEGRFHLYEGYSPQMVSFPVRVMQMLGVKALIVTNAAGGLNLEFSPGDIMVILDHINFTGENPLTGPNIDPWGIRFPDMTRVYSRKLIELARMAAVRRNMVLKEGIYLGLKGPSLETPAEMRFLRQIGADAVGMSTIQEVIAAVHGGMKVLGLSVVTNINDPDRPSPSTIEDIIGIADNASAELADMISYVVGEWK